MCIRLCGVLFRYGHASSILRVSSYSPMFFRVPSHYLWNWAGRHMIVPLPMCQRWRLHHKSSIIRRTKSQKRNCFSSWLAVVFTKFIDARCYVENEGGNVPTTSEWLTSVLPTKISEVWWYIILTVTSPDSKVRGANMGPGWVLSAPDGPHIGPMNLAITVATTKHSKPQNLCIFCGLNDKTCALWLFFIVSNNYVQWQRLIISSIKGIATATEWVWPMQLFPGSERESVSDV